jgi:hypothetical protein
MTKNEVLEAVKVLRSEGWEIIDVIDTRAGFAVIAADSVGDHVTYETAEHARNAGIA